MDVFDLITNSELAAYWNQQLEDREPFLGETLFPNRKQRGLTLSWIKGRKGLPIVLKASAFDVQVIPRPRKGFEKLMMEIPFFKESFFINEELRQELILVSQSNNQTYVNSVIENIFDDQAELLESAAVTRERLRMDMLTTGSITFESNGQSFDYDYQLDPGQFQTTATTGGWADTANADPLADLQVAVDYVLDETGETITRGIMNKVTWRYFRGNEKIKNEIYIINALVQSTGAITDQMVERYFADVIGITFYVYDKRYINELGQTVKYVADNIVVLFPEGTLGSTVFGTTPEEADLMGRIAQNVSIVDTGVAITTMVKPDPVSVELKVSQVVMPSFEEADKVVILDVAARAS